MSFLLSHVHTDAIYAHHKFNLQAITDRQKSASGPKEEVKTPELGTTVKKQSISSVFNLSTNAQSGGL